MERHRLQTGNALSDKLKGYSKAKIIILLLLALLIFSVGFGIGFLKGTMFLTEKIVDILKDREALENLHWYIQHYILNNQTAIDIMQIR